MSARECRIRLIRFQWLAFVLLLAQFTFFLRRMTGKLYFHREIKSIYRHVYTHVCAPRLDCHLAIRRLGKELEEQTIKGTVFFQHSIDDILIDECPNFHAGHDEIFFRGKPNIVECFARTCAAVVEISVQPQAVCTPRAAKWRDPRNEERRRTRHIRCLVLSHHP
jgi:hypothetical protein